MVAFGRGKKSEGGRKKKQVEGGGRNAQPLDKHIQRLWHVLVLLEVALGHIYTHIYIYIYIYIYF